MIQKGEKVVVTGGTGFIGSHLCNTLSEQGLKVIALDIAPDTLQRVSPAVEIITGDIRDIASLTKAFQSARYIFHTAALPRVQYSIDYPQESNETNITGTLNVLLAAKDAGVKRVVYSASSSAYGDQSSLPLVETMRANPKSPYALQKYVGELYATLFSVAFGLSTVSLRYFNVYGPAMDPEGAYALMISKFIKLRQEGKSLTVTGDGNQTRDFTHIRDVVHANLLAAESTKVGKGEVINIGAGNNVSVNRIAELLGGPVDYIPARLEPRDTLADNSLAKELLGWEPTVSIEEGIAELKQLVGLRD